jgi:hypothetical protein
MKLFRTLLLVLIVVWVLGFVLDIIKGIVLLTLGGLILVGFAWIVAPRLRGLWPRRRVMPRADNV